MENQSIDLNTLRHSAAHVLAAAVCELYPDVKLGIGPAINDGFYYDFEFSSPINEADLPKIENLMRKIIKESRPFICQEIDPDEADKLFVNQPYKLELIKDLISNVETGGDLKLSIYKTGNFLDLCKGPHVENSSKIGVIKLTRQAGAYWRGDEKNKMLTRIYGTVFPTQRELDDFLKSQSEAKKRDHRVLGRELDLFVFSDLVGKGLPLFTPKGSIIRRELERFIVDEEIRRGYQHVYTPELARVDLYKTSGHYPYYKETMYPLMKIDDEELILRPMACPHHFQLYARRPHSYRELPVRLAELAKQFRYEKSGELTGLSRVRSFCLADAHIICRKDQAVDEINNVLSLIEDASAVLGLKPLENYRYRLSLGNRLEEKKYYKDDVAWGFAEGVLRQVLQDRKAPYYEAENEAAFYGPKIDIQMKKVFGQEETAFTVQYDFVMPKRFKLAYINENGQEEEPVVIHRSSIGALERVLAFLIEHYAGAFPVWLSPVQAVIIPVSEKSQPYAVSLQNKLLELSSIRLKLDNRNETMSAKIRDAQNEKIPYMLIVGEKEMAKSETAGNSEYYASVRLRSGENIGLASDKEIINRLKDKVDTRSLIL